MMTFAQIRVILPDTATVPVMECPRKVLYMLCRNQAAEQI